MKTRVILLLMALLSAACTPDAVIDLHSGATLRFDESYGSEAYGTVISPDKVTVRGVGSGHGVGFSATGSEKLSLEGYDFRYILQFYFKGTEIKRLYQ